MREEKRTKEKDAEDLLLAFESLGLCGACWRRLLDIENKPKLASRLLKWCRGEYSDYYKATNRLEKYFKNPKYEEVLK